MLNLLGCLLYFNDQKHIAKLRPASVWNPDAVS